MVLYMLFGIGQVQNVSIPSILLGDFVIAYFRFTKTEKDFLMIDGDDRQSQWWGLRSSIDPSRHQYEFFQLGNGPKIHAEAICLKKIFWQIRYVVQNDLTMFAC